MVVVVVVVVVDVVVVVVVFVVVVVVVVVVVAGCWMLDAGCWMLDAAAGSHSAAPVLGGLFSRTLPGCQLRRTRRGKARSMLPARAATGRRATPGGVGTLGNTKHCPARGETIQT